RLSRLHCKIVRVGMGYRLVDLDSRNGTFVNGMRVLEHPLASFDEIQIGASKIRFLVHDIMAANLERAQVTSLVGVSEQGQTESIAVAALSPDKLVELQQAQGGGQLYEIPDNLEAPESA